MGFVLLFVQTAKEKLMHELRNSLILLHRGGSTRINRFRELLMRLWHCSAIDRTGYFSSDTRSVRFIT